MRTIGPVISREDYLLPPGALVGDLFHRDWFIREVSQRTFRVPSMCWL